MALFLKVPEHLGLAFYDPDQRIKFRDFIGRKNGSIVDLPFPIKPTGINLIILAAGNIRPQIIANHQYFFDPDIRK